MVEHYFLALNKTKTAPPIYNKVERKPHTFGLS